MNDISIEIAKFLNLSQPLTTVDYLLVLATVVLVLLSIVNLVSAKKEVKLEKKKLDEELKKEAPAVPEKVSEVSKEVVEPTQPKVSWDKRLFNGLSKTRSEVWGKLSSIIAGRKLDDEVVEELEEVLFTSDLSPVLVDEMLEKLKTVELAEGEDYLGHVKEFMKSKMLAPQQKVNTELYDFKKDFAGPKVIMIVGVNGAGKTTTIGKLATKLKSQGAKVVVGACDTFRAAAVEQLEVWCNRAGVDIVKAAEGADPSGVAYDAVAKAKEVNADYCIIDTAGRLHTKSNLMDELAKTKKVMSKVIPDAPHETLLVLDAITGQNALKQAEEFNKALKLTGLIFTKCDGSSKAGSAVSIVQTLDVPIVYIGVGEDVEDLDIFNLDLFLDALLGIKAL